MLLFNCLHFSFLTWLNLVLADIKSSVKHAFIQMFLGSFHIYGSLRLSAGVLPYVSLLGMCRPKGHGFCAVLAWKRVLNLPILALERYPGYQRFFSRVAGIFGVDCSRSHKRRSAGSYKDLTETGNRARKASGTQGTLEVAHETESLLGRIALWETLSTLLLVITKSSWETGSNFLPKTVP